MYKHKAKVACEFKYESNYSWDRRRGLFDRILAMWVNSRLKG